MSILKKILSGLILTSPVVVLAACYGPRPYDCFKNSDCIYRAGGTCDIKQENDYYGNQGGYCRYPADNQIEDTNSDH